MTSNLAEADRRVGRIVCEIVDDPNEISNMVTLFQLAGTITSQEVDVLITGDPGEAGAAILAESGRAYPMLVLNALNEAKKGLRSRPFDTEQRIKSSGVLEQIISDAPYTRAGLALFSVVHGASAVFVNVEDPFAFRRELDVLKSLAQPL